MADNQGDRRLTPSPSPTVVSDDVFQGMLHAPSQVGVCESHKLKQFPLLIVFTMLTCI